LLNWRDRVITYQEIDFSKKNNPKNLHILLISVHGLIRAENLELGRDADTGGQTKYVVELAKSLGELPNVDRVDLVTRLVKGKDLSEDYVQPLEKISQNVNIVRLETVNTDYVPKEQLWDQLDHFSDNLAAWITENNLSPNLIHSHYADAGYVGVAISNLFNLPLVHTGHSLGRDKRKRLLAKGLNKVQIENRYNLTRRIEAEEQVLANADLVIASTNNEIEEQYGLYNYYDPSRMSVIPPGTDLERFYPPEQEKINFIDEISHFLIDSEKPFILALSRPY
jgi:sucrose-phosphate synthase